MGKLNSAHDSKFWIIPRRLARTGIRNESFMDVVGSFELKLSNRPASASMHVLHNLLSAKFQVRHLIGDTACTFCNSCRRRNFRSGINLSFLTRKVRWFPNWNQFQVSLAGTMRH